MINEEDKRVRHFFCGGQFYPVLAEAVAPSRQKARSLDLLSGLARPVCRTVYLYTGQPSPPLQLLSGRLDHQT